MNHQVKKFEDIVKSAMDTVAVSNLGYVLNFSDQYIFGIDLLKEPQLLDVAEKARLWQSTERPAALHFSHGEYIGTQGLDHIADELKRKKNSNRALASLISQEDVIGSGDAPIPSFMIYQCALEGDTLYVTVYFRALEVSKFFRINLEEIRLMTYDIYKKILNFNFINLTVLAFRAHITSNMNTLEKCELDQLDDIDLLKLVEKNPHRLPELLREKGMHSTIIAVEALQCLRRIFGHQKYQQDIPFNFNRDRFLSLLDKSIAVASELVKIRQTTSHHPDIGEKVLLLANAMSQLAQEVESCLNN
jgi:hypothetical protein